RQQSNVVMVWPVHLVEVFGDDRGSRNRRMPLVEQHRCGSGRIDRQKIRPALPGSLLDQASIQPGFAECKPPEPGMRTERMVKEGEHAFADIEFNLPFPRAKRPVGDSPPSRGSELGCPARPKACASSHARTARSEPCCRPISLPER